MRACLSHPIGPLGMGCAAACSPFMINFLALLPPGPFSFGVFRPWRQRPRIESAYYFILWDGGLCGCVSEEDCWWAGLGEGISSDGTTALCASSLPLTISDVKIVPFQFP